MPHKLNKQTFVGIAGHDSRPFASAFRDRLSAVEAEPTHRRISVAAVAIGGEQGANLGFEKVRRCSGLRVKGARSAKGEYHQRNRPGIQSVFKADHTAPVKVKRRKWIGLRISARLQSER